MCEKNTDCTGSGFSSYDPECFFEDGAFGCRCESGHVFDPVIGECVLQSGNPDTVDDHKGGSDNVIGQNYLVSLNTETVYRVILLVQRLESNSKAGSDLMRVRTDYCTPR